MSASSAPLLYIVWYLEWPRTVLAMCLNLALGGI